MRGANFEHAVMTFSRFAGADLTGANLGDTDLSRADFTGANLTDADFTGADLDGATLLGVKGLDTVKGLATALNFDKTIRYATRPTTTSSGLESYPGIFVQSAYVDPASSVRRQAPCRLRIDPRMMSCAFGAEANALGPVILQAQAIQKVAEAASLLVDSRQPLGA